MVRQCVLFVVNLLFVSTAVAQTAADSPFGFWLKRDKKTGEPKAIIEVYKQENRLYARVDSLVGQPRDSSICTDCKGALQDTLLIGLPIIQACELDDGIWTNGKILRVSNGKMYDAEVWIEDDKLAVRGYLGFLYKTQYWEPYD